jgi:hypothetical protein
MATCYYYKALYLAKSIVAFRDSKIRQNRAQNEAIDLASLQTAMLGRSAMTSPREEDKQCKFPVSHQALSCVLLPLIVVILISLSIYEENEGWILLPLFIDITIKISLYKQGIASVENTAGGKYNRCRIHPYFSPKSRSLVSAGSLLVNTPRVGRGFILSCARSIQPLNFLSSHLQLA